MTLSRDLTTAIHFREVKTVKKLLKSLKKKPLTKIKFIFGGYRLLKLAIGLRRKDIAILLINKGARVNVQHKRTLYSPLLHAIRENYLDIVKLLIRKGADINQNLFKFSCPLFFLVYQRPSVIKLPGRIEIMKYLLRNGADTEAKFDPNRSPDNLTPLYLAICTSNFKLVKLLLKYNANVNTKRNDDDCYATAEVVFYGRTKIMSLLLNHGAKSNFVISNYFIERHFHQNSHVCRRLESLGDPTLLHFAIIRKQDQIVELLIQYGADVHARTKVMYRTPLMLAIEEYDPIIVQILLRNGARVTDYDGAGISPLHYIICNPKNQNKLYTMKMLLSLQAKKLQIYKLLLKAGADINEALEPLGSKLTFISAAATYGQYVLLNRSILGGNLDCSLIDCSILEKARFDIELMPQAIVDNPDNLLQVKNAYRLSEMELLKGILKSWFKNIPLDEDLIITIDFKPINDFISQDEHNDEISEIYNDLKYTYHKMYGHKIGDSKVSLWHLLTSPWNRLINHAYNKDVRKLRFRDYKEHIAYSYELKNRIKAAIKRSKLLENAVEVAFILFKSLPLDCCKEILSYLSDDQLETFNDIF